jgi:16S rRNA (guanine527-N7)-methyltransferase
VNDGKRTRTRIMGAEGDLAGDKTSELLKQGIRALGLLASDSQTSAFMTYLSELKKWNKAYNLTAINKDADIVIKHFLDSLLYLKAMPEDKIKIADIGSGAGFPGIPLKIVRPEMQVYLIESSRKKCVFLRHIIRMLHLKDTEVIEKRVEEVRVNQELSEPVDIAVSRALFDIDKFLKKAGAIVKENGSLVLNKGPKIEEELKALKGIRYELLTVKLPLSQITRYVVLITPGLSTAAYE